MNRARKVALAVFFTQTGEFSKVAATEAAIGVCMLVGSLAGEGDRKL
jgi:hypothetical protein